MQALVFAAKVDAGNVLVVELGGGAGLLMKPQDVLRISGHVRWQNFQGHGAIELGIAGADHRSHAADPNRFDQLEMSQAPAAQIDQESFLGTRSGTIGRLGNNGRAVIGHFHGILGKSFSVRAMQTQRRTGLLLWLVPFGLLFRHSGADGLQTRPSRKTKSPSLPWPVAPRCHPAVPRAKR
jgi:hypothetical protein